MGQSRTAKKAKGQLKARPDTDDPSQNPLLLVENKHNFQIETGNFLQDPGMLMYEGFDSFDLTKETGHFDVDQLNEDSEIIIILKYFEYICIADFRFCYVKPILQSGFKMKDVFDMVKHCLKSKLQLNVPTFDTIYEPEIQYFGKIKYIDLNRY